MRHGQPSRIISYICRRGEGRGGGEERHRQGGWIGFSQTGPTDDTPEPSGLGVGNAAGCGSSKGSRLMGDAVVVVAGERTLSPVFLPSPGLLSHSPRLLLSFAMAGPEGTCGGVDCGGGDDGDPGWRWCIGSGRWRWRKREGSGKAV